MYIKYNNKEAKNDMNNNNDLSLNFLNESIKNFKIFNEKSENNKELKSHIDYLYNTINAIKNYITNIELIKIEIDNSYEFNIEIIQEKKESLYIKIIELKNNNKEISEISIGQNSIEKALILSK